MKYLNLENNTFSGYYPLLDYITDEKLELSNVTFNSLFNFSTLVELIQFKQIKINTITFSNVIFNDDFTIGCIIPYEEENHYREQTILYNIDFSNVVFIGEAFFDYATYKGVIDFRNVTFVGYSNFNEAVFSQLSFKNVDFEKTTFFGNSLFLNDVEFFDSIFEEAVYFRKSTFNGKLYFNRVNFMEIASFNWSTFDKTVRFIDYSFHTDLTLLYTTFYEDLYLVSQHSKPILHLITVANMKVYGIFSYRWKPLKKAIKRSHKHFFIKNDMLFVKRMLLSSLCFIGIIQLLLYELQFYFTFFVIFILLITIHYLLSKTYDVDFISKDYLALLKIAKNQENYIDEDNAYLELTRYKYRYHPYKIFGVIGDFGISPMKVLAWFIGIFFSFGIIYAFLDSYEFRSNDVAINLEPLQAFYYSGITMLTIGYGDISPDTVLTQGLSVLQGFLGVFLTAYFVVSITRKTLR